MSAYSQTPLVSVIMNTHNYAQFIGQAIESVLNQTYPHFELIIIDDASTDNTLDIIQNYHDSRIKLIKRDECSCSGAMAKNDGFKVAKGKLIAIADSDDINMPNRLEKQVAYFLNHPKTDLLGGGIIRIDAQNNRLSKPIFKPRFKHKQHYRHFILKGKSGIHFVTLMFRKSILKKLQGLNDYMASSDYEFQLRASRYFRFANLNQTLVLRRQHNQSVTQTIGNKLRQYHHEIFIFREYHWIQKQLERRKH